MEIVLNHMRRLTKLGLGYDLVPLFKQTLQTNDGYDNGRYLALLKHTELTILSTFEYTYPSQIYYTCRR